jgi:hypothetical protein
MYVLLSLAEYIRKAIIKPRRQLPHNLARSDGEIAPVKKPTAFGDAGSPTNSKSFGTAIKPLDCHVRHLSTFHRRRAAARVLAQSAVCRFEYQRT